MCEELEEMREEAKKEEKLEMAKKLISMGKLTVAEIVSCSGLPIETITELAKA